MFNTPKKKKLFFHIELVIIIYYCNFIGNYINYINISTESNSHLLILVQEF